MKSDHSQQTWAQPDPSDELKFSHLVSQTREVFFASFPLAVSQSAGAEKRQLLKQTVGFA